MGTLNSAIKNVQNTDTHFYNLMIDTVEKWEKYKDDFFLRNDPLGVLKASFAVCYFLFVLEFTNEPDTRIMSNNSQGVNGLTRRIENIIRNTTNPNQMYRYPGFDYYNGRRYSGMVILKKKLLGKSYEELESGMIDTIQQKSVQLNSQLRTNRATDPKNIFKYTGYASTSLFTNVFFYHSLVMFGWYMCYGFYKNRTGQNIVREFPGSCNVQGCINMYIFKKYGILDRIVYVPHGKQRVSTQGEISSMTATRAQGIDDVQFCHHGFRLVNVPHNTSSGYFGNHYVKAIRSHIDAFDVLTLTPIFRCIQRLKRTGKTDRVKYINDFIDIINTDIKDFLKEHRMSNLPGTAITQSTRIRPNTLESANIVRKNVRSNTNVRNWIIFRKFVNYIKTRRNLKENYGSNNSSMNERLKNKYRNNFNVYERMRKQLNRNTNIEGLTNSQRRAIQKVKNLMI
jgi:hypothetical protein